MQGARDTASVAIAVTCAAGVLASACSTERTVTSSARTAMHQLVISEATERALRMIRWPSFPGQRVFVSTTSAAAAEDQAYLKGAVEMELARRGAVIAPDLASADLVAVALAGSLGTEQTTRFVGTPAMQSLLLPLPIPEVALYKSKRQDAFTKVEMLFLDPKGRRVLFRDGPAIGEAYWTEFSVLLFSFYRTDTSRQPAGVFDDARAIPGSAAPRAPAPPPAVIAPPPPS